MTGEPAARGEREPKRAAGRRLTLTAGAAGIALVSSGVALVFTLWPGLRPDPRTHREAEVSIFAVERGVTYGDYLRRTTPTGEPTREGAEGTHPSLRGELVYVAARVRGFKRSSVQLRWSAYNARTDKRERAIPLAGVPDSEHTLETPTERFVQPVFVFPLTGQNRRFFVRVELVDSDGSMLAVADSEPFAGLPR